MYQKKERIYWIDNAKVIAMAFVVFGHINGLFSHALPFFPEINHFIVSFNMTLFVFLSGITSYKGWLYIDSKYSYFGYLKKTAIKLFLPFVAALLIESLVVGKFSLQGGPWYLRFYFKTLLCFSTTSYFTYWVCNKANKLQFRKALTLLISFVVMFFISATYTPEFAFPFVFGTVLALKNFFCFERYPFSKIALVICSLLCLLLFYGNVESHDFYKYSFSEIIHNRDYMFFIERQLVAISITILICLIIKLYCNKQFFFSKYGKDTLGIYILHSLLVVYYKNGAFNYLEIIGTSGYIWLLCLLLSVFVWYLCVFSIIIIRKNVIMKLLLLGEK